MPKSHTLSTLTLEPRSGAGTTKSHALRAAGKIPGVVYGHGEPTPVTIDSKVLTEIILSGNRSHVLNAVIGGAKDSLLIRHINTDPLSRKALSVDFQRISKGDSITSSVHIVTVGTAKGVKDEGGIMDVVTHALDIKGPATSLPDSLEVDVSGLSTHQHITAGQVKLPKGFTLVTPAETTVVSVEVNRAAESIAEADAAVAAIGSEESAAAAEVEAEAPADASSVG